MTSPLFVTLDFSPSSIADGVSMQGCQLKSVCVPRGTVELQFMAMAYHF